MNLLDLLPNIRMAGENRGQLNNDFFSYINLKKSIEFGLEKVEGVEDGAWKHFPIPEQSLACPIQNMYEAINPPKELDENYRGDYDDSDTIIGFKTVRLHQALTSKDVIINATNITDVNGTLDDQEYHWWDEFDFAGVSQSTIDLAKQTAKRMNYTSMNYTTHSNRTISNMEYY